MVQAFVKANREIPKTKKPHPRLTALDEPEGVRLLSVVLGLFAATGWQVGCRTAPKPPAPLRFEATAPAGLGQPLSFNDDDFVYALALGHQEPLVAYAHHVYDDQELSLASWGESAYLWRAPLHRSEFDCLDMTFAPDDLEVAAASTDGALRLYPVQERGEPKIFFEGEPLTGWPLHRTDVI